MGQIERLTTSERLRLARKRRGLQLKRWAQREREYNLKRKQCQEEQEENTSRVNFVPAIMLLSKPTSVKARNRSRWRFSCVCNVRATGSMLARLVAWIWS